MDSRQQIAQPQEGISRSIIGQEHIVERLLLAGIVCLLLTRQHNTQIILPNLV
jgi:hypothetical protein